LKLAVGDEFVTICDKVKLDFFLLNKDTNDHLHHQGDKNNIAFLRSVRRLLVTANVVPSSPIIVTLMMEVLRSSETSVLARATRRNIFIVTAVKTSNRNIFHLTQSG
jgi:hypothetical protein